ncbi:hypothetical protein WN943_010717 [Citrus x changshan-huyou]
MTNMWPCHVPDGYIYLASIKPFPSEGSNHFLIDPNYPFPQAWMLYKLGHVLFRREECLICGNCPHITCTDGRDRGIPTRVGLFFFRFLKPMARTTYYVVFVGRRPGIYESWPECQLQVNGFPRNLFKSYKSKESAEKAYEAHCVACNQEAKYSDIVAADRREEIPTSFNAMDNDSLLINRKWFEVGVTIALFAVITAAVLKLIK